MDLLRSYRKSRLGWRAAALLAPAAAVAALGFPSCTDGLTGDDDGPPAATATAAVFPAGCQTATAHRTVTASGMFNQAAGYTSATCADAYLLNLNDYATTNSYGTVVTYNSASPTTKAACEATEISTAVWSHGRFGQFLGEAISKGVWVRDPDGAGTCALPRLVLEQRYPSFRPTGLRSNFRIAIKARAGTTNQRAISFATLGKLIQPSLNTMQFEMRDAQVRGLISPLVHNVWLRKGTPRGDRLCRAAQLDLTLQALSGPALIKAGADTAAVSARMEGYRGMRNALCLTGATRTEAAFQTATLAFLDGSVQLRDSLASDYATQAATLGVDPGGLALTLVDQLERQAFGLLGSNCAPSPADLYRYVRAGTLPSQVPADRLLLGACRGSSPEQLAPLLGVGGARNPTAARTTLAECLAPQGRDICNDPRASEAPDEGTAPADTSAKPPEDDVPCMDADNDFKPCQPEPAQPPPLPPPPPRPNPPPDPPRRGTTEILRGAELEQFLQEMAEDDATEAGADNAAETRGRTEQVLNNKPDPSSTQLVTVGVGGLGYALSEQAVARGFFYVGGMWITVAGSVIWQFSEGVYMPSNWECDFYRPFPGCEFIPWRDKYGPPGTNQHCAADFAPGGWYAAGESRYTSGGGVPRNLTESDRLEHCICKTMEPLYGGGGGAIAGVAVSKMCPTKQERLAQECMTGPWEPGDGMPPGGGPDDGPRPECAALLQPGQISEDVWRSRICNAVKCPENLVPSRNEDGGCDCINKPQVVGGGLGCPISLVSYCTADNPGPCLCTDPTYGNVPFGNDPSCRFDPTTFPGSLEAWTLPRPDLVNMHRIGTEDFVAFAMGQTPQVSAITPSLYRNSFAQVGTILRPRAFISASRPGSTNLDLQLYCTNAANNLFHGFMGQCRLNALTPGQPSSCDITLNSGLRNQCLNGAFTFEFNAQAPTSYKAFIGVGKFDFAGTLETTPVGTLAPLCPRPNPFDFTVAPRPLWEELGGTQANPDVSIGLGGGGTTRVIPAIYLPTLLDR